LAATKANAFNAPFGLNHKRLGICLPSRSTLLFQSSKAESRQQQDPLFNLEDIEVSRISFSVEESPDVQSSFLSSPNQGDDDEEDDSTFWTTDPDDDLLEEYTTDENSRNNMETELYRATKQHPTIEEFMRDEDDILTEREDRLYTDEKGTKLVKEKCILVGVEDLSAARRSRSNRRTSDMTSGMIMPGEEEHDEVYFSLEESMKEMRELIKTAGMECVGEITQRLNEPNRKTYIGTGKIKEVEDLSQLHQGCCTVVFDAELMPGQQKALENIFNKDAMQNDFMGSDLEFKVIDRTALILDIFAQHAKTREGKLQVDLALHEYRKPRLTKMWTHLERQSGAGGVGLRGPGESQLEIDKRLVRDRIIVLKKKIDDVQKQRDLHRRGRHNLGLPILALVGYTNAGKTTLLNYLTRAGAMAEDILFATLDPTTRKVKLPGFKTHPEVLLTDTVGFIQKLPTQLVAAFRATLEEVREADVLVHVIDVSNPMWKKQEAAVQKVLREIGAGNKPIVRVLNKIDMLEDGGEELQYEAAIEGHSVAVSSLTGEGMEDFVSFVEDALVEKLIKIEVVIPFNKGEEINTIHEVGNVEVVDYRPNGTYICGRVPQALANRLEAYSVKEERDSKRQVFKDADDIDWVALGRGRHSSKEI